MPRDWDASKDTENDVPVHVIEAVDDAVKDLLPPGTKVVDITLHGSSFWTRTAKIQTQQAHDPELTPRPIAVGTYQSDPKAHFFLCEFMDMTDELPDLYNFPAKLAKLHENSVSPTGQYGFGTPTCLGVGRPHYHKWTDTWEEFYLNFFLDVAGYEQEVQGPDEEMAELVKAIAEKVILRLCCPLETGGRSIKPRLIHGDLWDGNASVVIETGLPVIFDACSMYTHNEYELAPFVLPRHKMNRPYIKEYIKFFPPSEPVEDFEDRVALYATRFDIISSSVYPGNLRFRNLVKIEMRKLVNKYPNGYEDFKDPSELDEKLAGLDIAK
ncbi:hypothetical protein VE00_04014 [Pseudogymnoascus sp. WSF 3629]|nr:hypothetical protein VE00_04014 [Pseudogymnoascus sp. WSF 3629]